MAREAAQEITRAAVESYYAEYGQYVETPGQESLVTQLGARINKRINEASFEEALRIHERISRLNDNTLSLHVEGYEYDIHPRDQDYPQAKANHLRSYEEELTDAINRIVGNL